MKATFSILFLFLFGCTLQAQWLTRPRVENLPNFDSPPLSWGYYFGVNTFDFNFDYIAQQEDVQTTRSLGFNVGIVGDLRISKYVNLRLEPGLVYAQRTLVYPDNPLFENENDAIRDIASTYIYVPLLVRLSTKRLNNMKPFVTFGVATALNLSSNESNPDDNFSGTFRTTDNNYFLDVGFGVDLYLFWFKFTPSIRGGFGTNDEIVQDDRPNSPWTGNIDRLRSRGVFLNFTFQ